MHCISTRIVCFANHHHTQMTACTVTCLQYRYEETKRDVTKWTPIVRVNREAPTLVFAHPKNDVAKTSSTAAIAAKFKPESKMEAEVAAMLKAAGAHNELQVEEAEEALALQVIL